LNVVRGKYLHFRGYGKRRDLLKSVGFLAIPSGTPDMQGMEGKMVDNDVGEKGSDVYQERQCTRQQS
jgi:hypothetical protein